MTQQALNASREVEEAVLGALLLGGEPRRVQGLLARGLRPEHFYWSDNGAVFTATVALADRQAALDSITVGAELDRLGMGASASRGRLDYLTGCCPAAGNYSDYADRVIELARWRERQVVLHEMQLAIGARDAEAWAASRARLESATAGTRTESYSPEQWASLLFDFFAGRDEANKHAVPLPFDRLTRALGGGLWPGEVCALSGPTSHGKSLYADQWLDTAAKHGRRCHLYMTEMTALTRGLRYLARRTGVPFMAQRRNELGEDAQKKVLDELQALPYGCTVAADWNAEDIVRDALRARYDFVVVDLLHGFHYEDERGLDRLSKAMQRLARVSTTVDGHAGTAVLAVTHLKEEGVKQGKVPRPTVASIKGGSSIKQDADFVMFVWQEQDSAGATTGEGEVWLAKGRSGERALQLVQLNSSRFRFEPRDTEQLSAPAESAF